MPNVCNEIYRCSKCCVDQFINQSMSEFAVFAIAWMNRGLALHYYPRKSYFERYSETLFDKTNGLLYSSSVRLEQYQRTGKGGNAKVVAVFSGLCANNSGTEAESGDCKIYNNRPGACKNFQLNGKQCRSLRNTSPIELE